MRFWAYGPFDVDLGQRRDHFWKQVRKIEDFDGFEKNSVCQSIGCYIFLMTRGKRHKPFYVGKTTAKNGFYGEIFTPHKLKYYGEIIENYKSYRPQMMLFPLITETERLSRAYSANKHLIEWMERTLIGMALAKNTDLYNKRDTNKLKHCVVDGVFGQTAHQHRYPASDIARRMLTDYED